VAFAGDGRDYGKDWKAIKEKVLAAYGHKCACCGKTAKDVHHRDYRPCVMSGDDLSPLVALCRPCHKQIDRIKGQQSWNAAEKRLAELVAQRDAEISN
jgi:5-methylcytosine-specific restriction endonuclease McrA